MFANEGRDVRSASASPERKRKTERFLSTVQPPTRTRKMSYKDETLKYRDHNLFSRKVPKNAEAVNIEVIIISSVLRTDNENLAGCIMRFLDEASFCVCPTEESDTAGGFLRDQQTHQVSHAPFISSCLYFLLSRVSLGQ